MKSTAPQIGFDRFIRLDWAAKAMQVRVGLAAIDELEGMLDQAHSGQEAKKKTRTVLNRLWLEPRAELEEFAQRGVEIYRLAPATSVATLTWGMALATYPFFAKVAEIVGRLTSIQGDCTTAEVHRRMAEIYGEREGTRRMTNMVLQTQIDWATLKRSEDGKTLSRRTPIVVHNTDLVQWMTHAVLKCSGRPISLGALASQPVGYPFDLGNNLGFVLSTAPDLELRADSSGTQLVALRI